MWHLHYTLTDWKAEKYGLKPKQYITWKICNQISQLLNIKRWRRETGLGVKEQAKGEHISLSCTVLMTKTPSPLQLTTDSSGVRISTEKMWWQNANLCSHTALTQVALYTEMLYNIKTVGDILPHSVHCLNARSSTEYLPLYWLP